MLKYKKCGSKIKSSAGTGLMFHFMLIYLYEYSNVGCMLFC